MIILYTFKKRIINPFSYTGFTQIKPSRKTACRVAGVHISRNLHFSNMCFRTTVKNMFFTRRFGFAATPNLAKSTKTTRNQWKCRRYGVFPWKTHLKPLIFDPKKGQKRGFKGVLNGSYLVDFSSFGGATYEKHPKMPKNHENTWFWAFLPSGHGFGVKIVDFDPPTLISGSRGPIFGPPGPKTRKKTPK